MRAWALHWLSASTAGLIVTGASWPGPHSEAKPQLPGNPRRGWGSGRGAARPAAAGRRGTPAAGGAHAARVVEAHGCGAPRPTTARSVNSAGLSFSPGPGRLPRVHSPPGRLPPIQGWAHLRSSPPRSLPAGSCPWSEPRRPALLEPGRCPVRVRGAWPAGPRVGGGVGSLERPAAPTASPVSAPPGPRVAALSPLRAPAAAASTPPADLKGAAPRRSGTLGPGALHSPPTPPAPTPGHLTPSLQALRRRCRPCLVHTSSGTRQGMSGRVLQSSSQEVERAALSRVGKNGIPSTKSSL